MPTTYNGIGTRYSGKRNAESRRSACQSCGRETMLESYDTRLWFVMLFIPIIPLGHKRILNACPVCRRHQVVELDKWETAKQLSISGALEKFHADPSPESAVAVHQQLLGFHQTAQADEFANIIADKYPGHASLHAYLGAAMLGLGRINESARYFSRSLELRPDLPEARAGVATQFIRENKLDEARRLLDFLEKPGSSQLYSLAPLEELADAFQKARRHDEALDLYSQLLTALPAIGSIKSFRTRVQLSEKALGKKDTILPKKKFSLKGLFSRDPHAGRHSPRVTLRGLAIASVILLLISIGFAIGNEYVRRHRALYFINATGMPATVTVQGMGTVKTGNTLEQMQLPEGHYHASISGAAAEELDFDIRASYFDRWFEDPVWIINIGGEALLVRTQAIYSRTPAPPSFAWSFGQSFVHFDNVTHPFKALPVTLQLKSNETRVLTHLDVFKGLPNEAVAMMAETDADSALRLGEWQLKRHPDDEATLQTYVSLGVERNQAARVKRFLESGLSRRPVAIQWHRLYQNLCNGAEAESQLAAAYDEMLKAEPSNSALLYLRGRITQEGSTSWFERAQAADQSNPYPHMALGYDRMRAGDWSSARPLLARAIELKPGDEQFEELYWQTRIGLGRYTELEKEAREKIQAQPLDFTACNRLCTLLAAQQRTAEANSVLAAFEDRASAINKAQSRVAASLLRYAILYASGDFPALQKAAIGDRTLAGSNAHFSALVEQGRLEEAARLHPLDDVNMVEPFHFFTMSLAWHLKNDQPNSSAWFERGLKLLENSHPANLGIAAVLRSDVLPQIGQVEALTIEPKLKAILYELLAARHPSKRAEFHIEARRFNVDYNYPYHFIQRISEPSSLQ